VPWSSSDPSRSRSSRTRHRIYAGWCGRRAEAVAEEAAPARRWIATDGGGTVLTLTRARRSEEEAELLREATRAAASAP
jgi:hypothetical protein